jgi:hypothetical protein
MCLCNTLHSLKAYEDIIKQLDVFVVHALAITAYAASPACTASADAAVSLPACALSALQLRISGARAAHFP